jgi:hypothetical protein
MQFCAAASAPTTPRADDMDRRDRRGGEATAKRGRDGRAVARALSIAAATAALGASVLAGLAAADPIHDAQSVAQDPGTAAGGQANTTYTPQPSDIQAAADVGWKQVAGAVYPGAEVKDAVGRSTVPSMGYVDKDPRLHTVDFFSVAFSDPDHGFAAGAACADPNATDLAGCPRVPVIYQYAKDASGSATWTEVYRGGDPGKGGDSGDAHGFVGAVAWIPDQDKVVAVGGDGCYPRREVPCGSANDPPANAADKIAGNGLVWVLENGSWHRTSTPPGMTGMTALAFSRRAPECGASAECGLAGGQGQVWMWKDGTFGPSYQYRYPSDDCRPPLTDPRSDPRPPCDDPRSPSVDNSGRIPSLRITSPFRIRQIAFFPRSGGTYKAVAVTSACCLRKDPKAAVDESKIHDDPTVNFPRVMLFRQSKWTIGGLFMDSMYGKPERAGTVPDSLYSVVPSGFSDADSQFSVVASPGAEERPVEPASRIVGPLQPVRFDVFAPLNEALFTVGDGGPAGTDTLRELVTPELASVRLVAADGDLQSHVLPVGGQLSGPSGAQFPDHGPDGVADWAVGMLRSTGQAIAYTTIARARALRVPYYPLVCPEGSDVGHLSAQCQVATNPTEQAKSRHLFSLPSYPLNAFTMIGTSPGRPSRREPSRHPSWATHRRPVCRTARHTTPFVLRSPGSRAWFRPWPLSR